MDRVLQITRWSEFFENADTRKRDRLKFFHAPSGTDSHGYIELMTCHGAAGLLAFGVFQALCQHAATMPKKVRGKFARANGDAMPLRQLALLIRIEICHLEQAVELLTSEAVGWLHWGETESKSADDLPDGCQQGAGENATVCRSDAGFVQGQGKGKGQGEGEEATRQAGGKLALASSPSAREESQFTDSMPTETAKRFEDLQKFINSLHPRWTKSPHFTAQELHDLHANARVWFDISDADRKLLAAYQHASIPESWTPRYWQLDSRSRMIQTVTDVLSHADRWKGECKRRGVLTGLEAA